MSDNISTLTSDTISKDIERKFSRMCQIQAELKEKFDYKWIKIVGILVQQFKVDHPDVKLPYDADVMLERCTKLREEYDELKVDVAPYYPHLQE